MIRKLVLILSVIILSFGKVSFAYKPNLGAKRASLVIDLHSGRIIHAHNEHELRYPASLVKMMTLYITFKKIQQGEIFLDQKLLVSKKAANMPRTNMSLRAGSYISVRKAILGLIVHSSNDAAVVLAENIAGDERNFVKLMNLQAKKLGMKNTNFTNASGWHDKRQKSTAYDLAKLTISIKKNFPKFFPWFSITKFTHNGITYKSHNRVLQEYEWATGMKTGFTNPSGFNLATTADKNGKQLVGIVLGENTARARDRYMMKLLDDSFHKVTYPATMQASNIIAKGSLNKKYVR